MARELAVKLNKMNSKNNIKQENGSPILGCIQRQHILNETLKGQLISKAIYGVLDSPKKNNEIDLT